ncbi:palmitoyl acyltransferase 3 [Novymonas esmeraldas]|uniref:Palmitoyltransferase n=1 Tax=Novymonas esmeraldas TaxID=1808958 RepID=A0AAW0ENH4_9TRYP
MNNAQLLRHALQRRHYLVAMWLMLQQRWFVHTFNTSARVLSWAVIALGMSLVTFTVVTLARDVVPVLTTPGTIAYVLLQGLVVLVSFNIYVNYLCATACSRRIGKAPATYAYRDPYASEPSAVPHDDSTDVSSSSSSSADDDNNNNGDDDDGAAAMAVSAEVDTSPQEALHRRRNGRGTALEMRPVAVGIPPLHGTRSSSAAQDDGATPAAAAALDDVPLLTRSAAAPSLPPPPVSNIAGIRVLRVFGNDTAAAAPPPPSLHETARARCGSAGAVLLPLAAAAQRTAAAYSRLWRRSCCARHCLDNLAAEASLETLRELEALAATTERYPPRLRAARVLDMPRRYCHHCRRLKAPREHHCAICNECVTKMDHHCPWINNCVDAENQRYFLLFIAWLWLGTALASVFMAYGYARQTAYAHRLTRLHTQWRRSPNKAAVEAELRALHMPYGPAGVLLTSYPVFLTFGVAVIICVCMSIFLAVNRRLVLENTTVIEGIYVAEKRTSVYRSYSGVYRSPYDLGAWLNFVDLFSPAGDPLVRMQLESEAAMDRAAPAATRTRRWMQEGRRLVQRAGIVVWLTGLATVRPIYGDGVHYPTFDSIVSGEPHPLMQSSVAHPT